MPAWKILITDKLEACGQEILRARAEVDDRSGIDRETLLEVIGAYDAVIVRSRTKMTADVFEAATRLKVVGRAGVGVDNIDLQAAREHRVTVVNAPGGPTIAAAEHALALMLALARHIPRADAAMKSGQWIKKQLVGVELLDKTLGIIGVGRIGEQVARRAAAFGMTILGCDPLIEDDEIRSRGATPATLDEVYDQADYISLHVPLTQETRGLIDGRALARMKRGVRLVSAARGGVVDEAALLEALESGQVAGAALDVFAQEPPGLTPLVAHPNVIATPHIGAQTVEAQARTAEDIAHEVLAALEGKPLRWRVA